MTSTEESQKQLIDGHAQHLANLTRQAESNSFDALKALIDYLVLYRASENAEIILEKGVYICDNYTSKLEENMYLVEEFFFASLTQKTFDWAQFFLQMIRHKSPKSVKSMRLLAMFHEAQGDVVKAQEILLDLFEENPTDAQTVKRIVCLFRDMEGMETQAIQTLNKYLENCQDDQEAWMELADIYLSKQNYSKACFCYEEIMTSQPRNYLVNLRYAECLYSSARSSDQLGDFQMARKYFSHASVLKEGQPCKRALYGIIACCKAITALIESDTKNKKQMEDPKNEELLSTAQSLLRSSYQKSEFRNIQKLEGMSYLNN